MLAKSDFPISTALELLTKHDIEAALLVPTPNGLEVKSTFDATENIRAHFKVSGFHEYEQQPQGQEYKVIKKGFLVRPDALEETLVSLYRPPTKQGDPRFWLGRKVKSYVSPFNLVALSVIGEVLYIINMSDPFVQVSLDDPNSPFRKALAKNSTTTGAANELLELLTDVASKGFIKTLKEGSTGVGYTLETLLGISANSSKNPDYKGIELKAKRSRIGRTQNRSGLFGKTPNWELSPIGNAMNLLSKRGYIDENGRLSLYHTLSSLKPNSLGLSLELHEVSNTLRQVYVDPTTQLVMHDTSWEIPILEDSLRTKHRETFWIKALTEGEGENERFHYVEILHTSGPKIANLSALLESGDVTVDYTMHEKNKRVRDHGYLFKLHPEKLGALFPPPKKYALV